VKQVQKRKKVVNWRALMIKQVTCGVKHEKPSSEPFLGSTALNIVIDNPVEVVSLLIDGDLVQLLNSLIFTTVKMHKSGKSHLKH
jgi:hypothetical protein